MGDRVKISPLVPSPCAHNLIFSFPNMHIIPSCQIYVGFDNPSLTLSISCLTSSSYLWKYVRTADNISHGENLPSDSCWCFSRLYEFQDGIEVTRVLSHCGMRQG